MNKVYPEKVVIAGNRIFDYLTKEDEIFMEFSEKEIEVAKEIFFDHLTEKFLNDEFDDDKPIYSEDELDEILNQILVNNVLTGMEEDGLLNSYEDENTEKIFFLTDKGKEIAKELNPDLKIK